MQPGKGPSAHGEAGPIFNFPAHSSSFKPILGSNFQDSEFGVEALHRLGGLWDEELMGDQKKLVSYFCYQNVYHLCSS